PRSADVAVMEPEERQRFENGKAAFLREARIVAQLDHPNVVRVRTFFNANGTAYLVMDHYDGMTMATYLAEKQPSLAPELAIPVMLPILDG
ncbi:protein kinase, partial [Enterococcus hirae]